MRQRYTRLKSPPKGPVMTLPLRDTQRHTCGDYRCWPVDGVYGKPHVREMTGTLAARVLPDVVVAWEKFVRVR